MIEQKRKLTDMFLLEGRTDCSADQLLCDQGLEEAAQEQENVGQTENTDESGEKDKEKNKPDG